MDQSAFRHEVSQMYSTRYLFAVITWGASGSHWLAKTLNHHPDISAFHHLRSAVEIWSNHQQPIDDLSAMRMVNMLGSSSLCAGDVHGISRESVQSLREEFDDRIRFAVLVREPIARLRSQFGLFAKLARYRRWDVTYARELLERHEIRIPAPTYESLLQVHGINMLNAVVEEREAGPIFRLEDLVREEGNLRDLVAHLSQDSLDWSATQEEFVARTNQHATEEVRFEFWHQDVMDALIGEQTRSAYESLGYGPNSFNLLATH